MNFVYVVGVLSEKNRQCPYCKEKVDLKRLFPNPWEVCRNQLSNTN